MLNLRILPILGFFRRFQAEQRAVRQQDLTLLLLCSILYKRGKSE
jgi:hypothetical protein